MSPRLPRVTAIELVRALERDGWQHHHQTGSHQVLRHPSKLGQVVVPMHVGQTIGPGLLGKTLKDAGLSADDLRRLL
jgi:predicted RNA binding protein YcfA (HicA-like mRNA interferase family)